MRVSRLASIATGSALAALLGACANPTLPPPASVAGYPSAYPAAAPMAMEYGRVTNIEVFQTGPSARAPNVPGALIGAVAGAVLGNQIGRAVGDRSRNAATVLGGIGGAAVGSQVGGGTTAGGAPVYRVTVQTDRGAMRVYDVPSPGELRPGDRVRIDNGVIYRF